MIKLEKEMKSLLSNWHKQLDTYKKDWVGKHISRNARIKIAEDLGVSQVTFYDKDGESDFLSEFEAPMVITGEWNIVTMEHDLMYYSDFDQICLDIKVRRVAKE